MGDSESRPLPLCFTGNARDYFRIWIVNLCLSIVTLGVYSAWAKVRKLRYLYAHTELAGTPFRYLGRPIPILKGRLIAVALAALWYVSTNFFPQLWVPVVVAALVLAPWAIRQSAAFRARYSAFRNLTFRFVGSYAGIFKTLYGWGLLTLMSCGLAYPWLRQRATHYMISHVEFGEQRGQYQAGPDKFVRPYLVAVGLAAPGAFFVMELFSGQTPLGGSVGRSARLLLAATYAVYFAVFTYLRTEITNLNWRYSRLGGVRFASRLSAWAMLKIYVTNTLAIVASAGLLIPWATIRVAKYRAEHLQIFTTAPLSEFTGTQASAVRAAGAETGDLFDLDVAL